MNGPQLVFMIEEDNTALATKIFADHEGVSLNQDFLQQPTVVASWLLFAAKTGSTLPGELREGVMSDPGGDKSISAGANLRGHWKRAEPDVDDSFPEGIEFREGTYLAKKGQGQRFIRWDAGTYELTVQPDSPREGLLTLSTASDSLETYPVSLTANSFEVVVKDGRRLKFDRTE